MCHDALPLIDAVIGTSCLGLKNLAMSEICHFVPVDSIEPELYTQLEALELWALNGVQLPALVIKQLTTPCQLVQNLLFRNCDAVTDQLLNELWAVRWFFLSSFFFFFLSSSYILYAAAATFSVACHSNR